MKKKNSLRLRKALASFSVLIVLFSQGTTVFASVSEGDVNQEEAQVSQTAATQESAATSPITEEAVVEETPIAEEPAETPIVPEQAEAEQAPEVGNTPEVTPEPSEPAPEPPVEKPEEATPEVPENPVDLSGLQAQLTALNTALDHQAEYTSASFDQAVLLALSAEAKELLANPDATQELLDACATKIQQALAALVKKGDTSALVALVQKAGQIKTSEYTEASIANLQNWIKQAQEILKNSDATQAQLAPIEAGLKQALAALVKTPAEKPDTEKPTPSKPKPDQPKPTQPDTSGETQPTQDKPSQGTQVIDSGDDSVNDLDDGYQVDSLTNSNLNGYELPLLSSYRDQRQAALVAQSLKTLGVSYGEATDKVDDQGIPTSFDDLSLTRYLYQVVLGIDLGTSYDSQVASGEKRDLEQAEIGDLLIWEENQKPVKIGLYLGQGKYLLADPEVSTPQVGNTEEEEDEPGVAIYTIQGYQEDEDGKVTIENSEAGTPLTGSIQNPSYSVHSFEKGTLTGKGQELIDTYGASVDFRVNENTLAFIDVIAEDARELGLKYDVYASVMIAQAILESGSGTSGLARAPYYNLFGIKGTYNGNGVVMQTMEDNGQGSLFSINASFRNYPSAKASLQDYVALIRGGAAGSPSFYQPTWRSEAKNYLQATEYLTGRYATDTQYNNKLNSLIAAYHLTQYDEPLVTDAGMVIADASQIPSEYRNKMRYPAYNGVNYNTSGSYPVGQCTWYVYNRISQLGGMVDDFMGNGGEWGQKGSKLGYQTTQTPTVGYAVSFHPGVAGSSTQYGHVAFVEAVGPEGILVSEGNVVGPLVVSYRVIPNTIARSNAVTYIAPK